MKLSPQSPLWIALAQAAKVLIQLLSLSVFARLLHPEDFGLVAMATVATNLANVLRDLGTGAAVIQRKELSPQLLNATFWLNLIFGIAIALALIGLSPLLANFYQAPVLQDLLICLSLAFPIASSATVHQSLLERRLEFRTVAGIEILSSTLALAIGVSAAYHGAGPFSLAYQTLSLAALSAVGIWIFSGWRPKGSIDVASLHVLKSFSGNLLGYNLVNYLARNGDSLAIGKLLGASQLGAYVMSSRVMLFPVQNLTFVMNRALLPRLSRHQSDASSSTSIYVRSLTAIAMISAPIMAIIWALREPLVDIAFGSKWSDSATLLAWLAPVGLLQSLGSTVGVVLIARGRTDRLFKLGILGAVLYLIAFTIGALFNLRLVVILYLIANTIQTIVCLSAIAHELSTSVSMLLKPIFRPIGMAILLGLGLNFLQSQDSYSSWDPILAFSLTAICGGAAYVLGVIIFARPSFHLARGVSDKDLQNDL